MELDDHVLRNRLLRERDPPLGDVSQDDARIGRCIDSLQVEDALWQCDRWPHGGVEKRLLRLEVPQHRSRSHAELAGDIREGAGLEPFLCE